MNVRPTVWFGPVLLSNSELIAVVCDADKRRRNDVTATMAATFTIKLIEVTP